MDRAWPERAWTCGPLRPFKPLTYFDKMSLQVETVLVMKRTDKVCDGSMQTGFSAFLEALLRILAPWCEAPATAAGYSVYGEKIPCYSLLSGRHRERSGAGMPVWRALDPHSCLPQFFRSLIISLIYSDSVRRRESLD